MSTRGNLLEIAKQVICNDRQATHGAPEDTFQLIADYWSVYLSKEADRIVDISAEDVAVMMALFKISRLQANPFHRDNIIDALGYMAIAGELIERHGSDEVLNWK